jgi:hypothetical protein
MTLALVLFALMAGMVLGIFFMCLFYAPGGR